MSIYPKHFCVPPAPGCGPSGSIVGRCIATALPWSDVDREISKRDLKREREPEA